MSVVVRQGSRQRLVNSSGLAARGPVAREADREAVLSLRMLDSLQYDVDCLAVDFAPPGSGKARRGTIGLAPCPTGFLKLSGVVLHDLEAAQLGAERRGRRAFSSRQATTRSHRGHRRGCLLFCFCPQMRKGPREGSPSRGNPGISLDCFSIRTACPTSDRRGPWRWRCTPGRRLRGRPGRDPRGPASTPGSPGDSDCRRHCRHCRRGRSPCPR